MAELADASDLKVPKPSQLLLRRTRLLNNFHDLQEIISRKRCIPYRLVTSRVSVLGTVRGTVGGVGEEVKNGIGISHDLFTRGGLFGRSGCTADRMRENGPEDGRVCIQRCKRQSRTA